MKLRRQQSVSKAVLGPTYVQGWLFLFEGLFCIWFVNSSWIPKTFQLHYDSFVFFFYIRRSDFDGPTEQFSSLKGWTSGYLGAPYVELLGKGETTNVFSYSSCIMSCLILWHCYYVVDFVVKAHSYTTEKIYFKIKYCNSMYWFSFSLI